MKQPDITAARVCWHELGKALESGEFQPPESDQWLHRAQIALAALSKALTPPNESPLASMVRDVLAEWDRGDLYKAAFEQKLRETICHFAREYLPRNEDLEKLTLVAKLAYQFKLRMQAFFIGGTKIQPFWDAIDDLPSGLSNAAHREMQDEIATWKADRPQ